MSTIAFKLKLYQIENMTLNCSLTTFHYIFKAGLVDFPAYFKRCWLFKWLYEPKNQYMIFQALTISNQTASLIIKKFEIIIVPPYVLATAYCTFRCWYLRNPLMHPRSYADDESSLHPVTTNAIATALLHFSPKRIRYKIHKRNSIYVSTIQTSRLAVIYRLSSDSYITGNGTRTIILTPAVHTLNIVLYYTQYKTEQCMNRKYEYFSISCA